MVEGEQLKRSGWKRVGYVLGGIVAAWALFVWFGNYVAEDLARWIADRRARAFDAAVAAERERLKQMEMADTMGGATPEETIRLIIAALEDGDIDRASKYYYVLDQEKAREMYQSMASGGKSIQTVAEFFKRILSGEKKCVAEMNACVFKNETIVTQDKYEYVPGVKEPILTPMGSKESESKTLILNQYTGIWKIKY